MQSCSRTRRKTSSWSELPEQSLRCIVNFIGNDVDTLRHFRSVCKKWRQSTSYSIPRSRTFNKKWLLSSVVLLRRRRRGPTTSDSAPWMVTTLKIASGFTLFFHPFYGTPFVNLLPNVDFSQFNETALLSAHHTPDFLNVDTLSSLFTPRKRLMLLMYHGLDNGVKVKHKNCLEKVCCSDENTDDVVSDSHDNVYSVDCNGNLCRQFICNDSVVTKELLISGLNENGADAIRCRNRLVIVEHRRLILSRQKLYLVVRNKRKLRVYLLWQAFASNEWKKTESNSFKIKYDTSDLVLFVTRDTSFFASAEHFPGCRLSNCIVFSHDAFPCCNPNLELPRDGPGIYVYQLGGTNHDFIPISSYPGFPCDLWSPPPWLVQGSVSLPHRYFATETEKDEKNQFVSNNMDAASSALFESEPMEQCTEAPSTFAAQWAIYRPPSLVDKRAKRTKYTSDMPSTSATNERIRTEMPSSSMLVSEEGSHLEPLRPGSNNSHPVSQACINCINQSKENNTSTVKFEGLDIKSNLLPTLQIMWRKHGNLIENSIIRSGDIVARALESLATVVLILEETSVRSFSNSQADYLSTTLSDLQCMHFKVDWLVPFVEKAVHLHKSKAAIISRNELLRCQAKVLERRARLNEELAELDQLENELKDGVANASRLIPYSGDLELDHPVGCGLS